MKKFSILVAVCGLLAFAGTAMAAQASFFDVDTGKTYYAPTPKSFVYEGDGANKTQYPYEIYLPNETQPANYRIHSNYTKNTDACASCHATHTAVGESLLQWYSVYETCMACHDGTVGTTYNVEDGAIGNTGKPTYGGHFGTGAEIDLSSHNVKGAVEIAAAPGGSVVSEKVTTEGGKEINMWGTTFGCESCHTPHGQGGNARILHPDPNGWATYNKKTTGYTVSYDAKGYYTTAEKVTLLKGYPYKVKVVDASGNDITTDFAVSNFGDTAVGSYTYLVKKSGATTTPAAVYGTAALNVKMAIGGYLTETETVQHVSGLNSFCGACHVDYNTEDEVAAGNGVDTIMGDAEKRPGSAPNGKYSQAHRHAVGIAWNYGDAASQEYIGKNKLMMTMGNDKEIISCLTCHFAHGTSQDYWSKWTKKFGLDTKDGWGSSLSVEEIAGSSALKRLPNMATCEACHQKGNAAEGYLANTSLTYEQEASTKDGMFMNALDAAFNAKYVDEINSPNLCTTSCHKEYSYDDTKNYMTGHRSIINVDGEDRDVICQTCHGPASLHVQAPSSMNIINPAMPYNKTLAVTNVCGKSGCHVDTAAAWQGSQHAANAENGAGANCVTCHSSHEGQTNDIKALKYNSAQALCATCHIVTEPRIEEAVKGVTAGNGLAIGHVFSSALIEDEPTVTNLAWIGSNWKSTKSILAQRKVVDHSNFLNVADVQKTTCWGGENGCHDNQYSDFVGTVHFSETGRTEGNVGGLNEDEPRGMRNRY